MFGNAGILIGMQAVTKVLGAILTIIVARRLGVESYGLWTFAGSLGGIFALVTTFGLSRLVTREVARDTLRTGETLGNILVLETVLSMIAAAGMAITLVLLGYSGDRLLIASVAGSVMLLNGVLGVIAAFFHAHQRMVLEAIMRIALSMLNLGLSLAVLFAGRGVLELAATQLGVFVLVVVLGIFLAATKLARPTFCWDWRIYLGMLGRALPFALAGAFIFVYDGTGVIFISSLRGDEATGLYGAAMNFLRIFGVLPSSLLAPIFPEMAQCWKSLPGTWDTLYRRSLKYLLVVALPITLGLVTLSQELVHVVLGEEYAGAALILRIAAWNIILGFLNHGLTNALISIDRERTHMRIVGVIMVFNVGANLALISLWGVYGAVVASLLTEGLVLAILSYVLVKDGRGFSVLGLALKPVVSVLVMTLGVYCARGLGLAPAILLGAVIYPLCLFCFRTFEADEIEALRSGWRASLARMQGQFRGESADSS